MTATFGAWLVAFLMGAAVGAFYFILLWFAVRSFAYRTKPFPFHLLAFYVQSLMRIGVVLGGLFLAILLGTSAVEIVLAMIGFIAARFAVTTFVHRQDRKGM